MLNITVEGVDPDWSKLPYTGKKSTSNPYAQKFKILVKQQTFNRTHERKRRKGSEFNLRRTRRPVFDTSRVPPDRSLPRRNLKTLWVRNSLRSVVVVEVRASSYDAEVRPATAWPHPTYSRTLFRTLKDDRKKTDEQREILFIRGVVL